MFFLTEITQLQVALFGAAMLFVVVASLLLLRKVLSVRQIRRRCEESGDAGQATVSASVIVYTNNDNTDLETLLPQLLSQEYDAPYEVIVVNEGDSAAVRDIVGPLQTVHRNLYLTHTPEGARNLSRKKLAITLGVKAARHPVVVLTSAGADISSSLWLSLIMRHFNADSHTGIVLGYAGPVPYEDKGFGVRARDFDFIADSMAWLTAAASGHPWRGDGYNVAYRRDLFFRNKGFSHHLNLRDGDDDIFISEIATSENTAIELSEDSVVRVHGYNSRRAALDRAARRRFTGRFISRRPRFLNYLARMLYTIAPVLALAGAAIDPFNWFGWTCAGTVILCWYLAGLMWLVPARILGSRRLCLTLPLLAFARPFRLTSRHIYALTHRRKRYTWE